MRKFILHIFAVSVAAVVCLACSSDKASVIPRGKLARIYAEMLVTDQWILAEPDFRRVADTTLVYEPILQKYGYDTQDYIKSVGYYMNDPERYSRILRTTAELLEERITELKVLKEAYKRKLEIESFVTDFDISEFYPYLSEEPYVHYYDSLAVEADSSFVYHLVSIERADTLYDLLRMVIRTDSLAVDSLVVPKDTIEEKPVITNTDRGDGLKLIRHSKLDSLKL
jgi:hypothetical protein